MRILIITGEALPGSEGRNLTLARELIKRGHSVRHTGPGRAMAAFGHNGSTLEDGFEQTLEARECNTVLFQNWAQLRRMVSWAQVVVISMAKGFHEIVGYAADLSKVIVCQADTFLDPWIWKADLVATGSPYERERFLGLIQYKHRPVPKSSGFKGIFPLTGIAPDSLCLTGSILLDQAAPHNQQLDKPAFLEKYGLDPGKKTAVWLSGSPAGHSSWYKDLYRWVCKAVTEEAGFNLILKPHPKEYARCKQGARYEDALTPTWRQLAPDAAVCDPGDKWDCFRAADVVISSYTSATRDVALARTPALMVDIIPFAMKYAWLDDPGLNRLLPKKRYTPPSRRPSSLMGPLWESLGGKVDRETQEYIKGSLKNERAFFQIENHEYIGTDCTSGELVQVLKEGLYEFDDQAEYDDYATRYSAGLDGQAYLRIADLVESVQTDPRLKSKLARAGSWSSLVGKKAILLGRNAKNRIASRMGRG